MSSWENEGSANLVSVFDGQQSEVAAATAITVGGGEQSRGFNLLLSEDLLVHFLEFF